MRYVAGGWVRGSPGRDAERTRWKAVVSELEPRHWDLLRAPFARNPNRRQLVGVEIEAGVVDITSGVSRPYAGSRGVAQLLRQMSERWGGPCESDGGNLIGFRRENRSSLGLESGCALEYASAPLPNLGALVASVNQDLGELADAAESLGLALLSGSMLPFDTKEDLTWAPKRRIPLMLEYFEREVGPQSLGWAAMAQIITVQTTLDYCGEEDLARKFRMANGVSSIIAALFVHSPIAEGRESGALARRMQIWDGVDRRRVGVFPFSLRERLSLDELIEWIIELPLIYRTVDGGVTSAPRRPFRSVLSEGFADGKDATLGDWQTMLSTTWPYVRVRDTLELRVADGPRFDHWAVAPALWVALAYDPVACSDAWELVRGYSLEEQLSAYQEVPFAGLRAKLGRHSMLSLARELMRIAERGLGAQIKIGREPAGVLSYLDPIREVVDTGVTWAERLINRWESDYQRGPRRYVAAFQYRGPNG
jgi:glutamate--cysteine ligase